MRREEQTPGGVSVQVKGKGIAVTLAMRDQVVSKMQKLDKYHDRLHTIDVELCWEKTRDADHHSHVEAIAHVPGRTIRVACVHADMYAAVDEAVDKLYRQLNRKKERIKSHHGAKHVDFLPPLDVDTDSSENESVDDASGVLHVERLSLRPQFEDEAIEEMETQNRSFYVFINARNEQFNVLYRRDDGSYAVIEPRAS